MIDMGRYDTLFEEVAAPSPLHPALIKAVAWQESRLDAGARGGVCLLYTSDAADE